MQCQHNGCEKPAEAGRRDCFRHRIMGVGFAFKGGARAGRASWNRTKTDFMLEHLGTTNEKELAAKGIVRTDKL